MSERRDLLPSTHRFDESDELRLVIEAPSWASAVEEGGRAVAELAFGGPLPEPDLPSVDLEVAAGDHAALLVAWLNELVFHAESDGWLPVRCDVLEAAGRSLRVRVGPRTWPSRSLPIKAATLHGARVELSEAGVRAEIVLDV